MMNLEGLNEWSREAVACSVAFARLGFGHDQIGAGIDSSGSAFVSLHHGGEQYNIILGIPVDTSGCKFVGKWKEVVHAIAENNVDLIKLEELCQRSMIWEKMDGVVATLVRRRFLNV